MNIKQERKEKGLALRAGTKSRILEDGESTESDDIALTKFFSKILKKITKRNNTFKNGEGSTTKGFKKG